MTCSPDCVVFTYFGLINPPPPIKRKLKGNVKFLQLEFSLTPNYGLFIDYTAVSDGSFASIFRVVKLIKRQAVCGLFTKDIQHLRAG
jgi:hypothetical protein